MMNTHLTVSVLLCAGWIIPYSVDTSLLRSAMMGKGILTPIFSSTFLTHAMWLLVLSTLSPSSSVLRFWSSGYISANAMNSVVHTGVKSAGWLNSMSQLPL